MKSSLFLVATSALLASAGPLRKRAKVTNWVTEFYTVTVTDDGSAPTPAAIFVEGSKNAPPPAVVVPELPPKVVNNVVNAPAPTQPPPPPPTPKPKAEAPVVKTPEVKVPAVKTFEVKPEAPVVKTPEVKVPAVKTPEVKPEAPVVKTPEVKVPAVKTLEVKPEAPKETQASAPTTNNLNDYQKTVINNHDLLRRNHGVAGLEWDDTLAQYAANTANGCVFEHDMKQGSGGYGQNLASQGSSGDIDNLKDKSVAQAITNQWYNGEIKNYSPFYGMANPNVPLGQVGHFTQVVWKSTKKVGCATVKCPAGSIFGMPSWYTVCNYQPAGNFAGEYGNNVLQPLGLSIPVV